MRLRIARLACLLSLAACCFGDDLPTLGGIWKLSLLTSNLNGLAEPVSTTIEIEQNGPSIQCFRYAGGHRAEPECSFSVGGEETHWGDDTRKATSQATRQNDAIVVTSTVEGAAGEYSMNERWSISADGTQLTIARDTTKALVGTGSVIVYRRAPVDQPPAARPLLPLPVPAPVAPAPPALKTFTPRVPAAGSIAYDFTVPAGTTIPLRVLTAVNTKNAMAGQRIDLMVMAPVLSGGHVVIPFGSRVSGAVTELKEAGRIAGRSEISLRFDSVTLPNGATKALKLRPEAGAIGGEHGGTIDEEGTLKGNSGVGKDAAHVAEGAAIGGVIGAAVARGAGREHVGMGSGIGLGAAAGAGAGLATILFTHGPSVGLARGTTVDMVLERDLHFTPAELLGPAAASPRR